ncbi:MAG: DUF3857 domain-containing protein [Ferruginibacter sp.]
MKKFASLFAGLLLTSIISLAQEFPDYGIIKSEEVEMKECPFDKDANAVILLHEAFSNYDDQHRLITNHHLRIKILKEKGNSAANISIPFYRKNNFEQISNIQGMTINIVDGNQVETRLDRKSIFTKATNERFGEVVFAFPAINRGSIIEYKYQSTMEHYGGLEDWYFGNELPVLSSKYTLVILPNMEFAYRVNKSPEIPVVVRQETGMGGVYFEMHNIPGLGNEPYMDARKDYLQQVTFQLSSYGRDDMSKTKYMTSWEEVNRELMISPEFGSQLGKNISGTDEFIKQTKLLALPEDKMKAVFNYVRAHMSWNNLYSKYAVTGVKEAWQKKAGTSGDINLLLVNLLKETGLEVYPMLVSERFHGKVNSSYPFIDQFNSVFACVVINGKNYYLDATDKSTPAHLTPSTILNTTALLVKRKAGGLINITDDTLAYKENILVNMELADNGSLTGDVTVNSDGYARVKKLDDYKEDRDKFLRRNFIVDESTIAGKDLEISNFENDSLAFVQHCTLTGNLNTTGEYSFLPLNLFTGFDSNPFLGDHRFSNINFGYRRLINLMLLVKIPANYIVDEVPKSIKLSDPDKEMIFTRQIEPLKDHTLRCMIQFEFKKSLFETYQYPVLKEIYQKMFQYLKEPVVLKKK